MLREIFKFSIMLLSAVTVAYSANDFKEHLQEQSFECSENRCFVRGSSIDVTYFINDGSVNVKSIGDVALIADSCDIAFAYFLSNEELLSAKKMLNTRIAAHNEYLNSELIFFSKKIYPLFISVGFFESEQKSAISCYISK